MTSQVVRCYITAIWCVRLKVTPDSNIGHLQISVQTDSIVSSGPHYYYCN